MLQCDVALETDCWTEGRVPLSLYKSAVSAWKVCVVCKSVETSEGLFFFLVIKHTGKLSIVSFFLLKKDGQTLSHRNVPVEMFCIS